MQKKSEPINRSRPATQVQLAGVAGTLEHSQSAPAAPPQRRESPAKDIDIKPRPLSAYDDNPVLNDAGAAFILGVTTACLKKWRHRKQGPDYLQYGPNGVVRYELKDLMEFRDKYTVRLRK